MCRVCFLLIKNQYSVRVNVEASVEVVRTLIQKTRCTCNRSSSMQLFSFPDGLISQLFRTRLLRMCTHQSR